MVEELTFVPSVRIDMISTAQLEEIKKYVREKMPQHSQHDFGHLERLEENARAILSRLDIRKRRRVRRNTLLASCYLHDLTYTVKLPGWYAYLFEGFVAKRLAIKLLREKGVGGYDIRVIARAISRHPHSFPFRRLHKTGDLYTQLLQDADTLDFFAWTRMESFGHKRITSRLIKKLMGEPHIFNVFFNLSESFEIFLGDRISFHFAEAGNKEKTPTLLLPGYADTVTHFAPLFNKLNSNQHLIVLDMPYLHYQGIWDLEDVSSFVHSFMEKHKLAKVHLAGFSFDGLVAVDFATRYPHKISSLTLLNSLPVLVTSTWQRMMVKMARPLVTSHIFTWVASRLVTNPLVRQIFRSPKTPKFTKARMKKFHHSVYGSLLAGVDENLTVVFNRLNTKKRIFLFEDDRIINTKKYHRVVSALDTPVTNLPKGGHGDGEEYWNSVAKDLF